jgi:uncharacterized protein RhaS with RHS repeats
MGANHSAQGRWLTPDPLGGDLTNPQSLNRYAYALNNPTTLIDPLGLFGQNPADCDTDPSGYDCSSGTIYNDLEWNYFNSFGNYYSAGTYRRAPFSIRSTVGPDDAGKNLSLREIADTTLQVSAPPRER